MEGRNFRDLREVAYGISSKVESADTQSVSPSAWFHCQVHASSANFSWGSTIESTWWLRSSLYFSQEEWKLSTSFQDTPWLLWCWLQWIFPTAVRSQVQRKLDKMTLGLGVHIWRVIFQSALGNNNQKKIITITPPQPQRNDLCVVGGMVIWEKSEQLVSRSSSTRHKHSVSQSSPVNRLQMWS